VVASACTHGESRTYALEALLQWRYSWCLSAVAGGRLAKKDAPTLPRFFFCCVVLCCVVCPPPFFFLLDVTGTPFFLRVPLLPPYKTVSSPIYRYLCAPLCSCVTSPTLNGRLFFHIYIFFCCCGFFSACVCVYVPFFRCSH
jgi:hypothetical protein